MAVAGTVTVSIVTFNSRAEIGRCLEAVLAQTLVPRRVFVWDNASTDGTAELLKAWSTRCVSVFLSKENVGFCAAHNRIITRSDSEFVLILNPDCYLAPDYLEKAVQAANLHARIGAIAGKLYRLRSADQSMESARREAILDSTGIFFTPSFRHFDRGSNEPESGRFTKPEWVFGVTGAAALYRRLMLEDVKIEDEYFDEGFFAYREDADLAWRMQSAGWQCLYFPEAVGVHLRKVLPDCRSQVAKIINMHSVKNRFLFRLNNVSWKTCVRFMIPMIGRDLAVIGYAGLAEHSSLSGLAYVVRNFRHRWRRRKIVQRRRKVALSELHRWIQWRPRAFEARWEK